MAEGKKTYTPVTADKPARPVFDANKPMSAYGRLPNINEPSYKEIEARNRNRAQRFTMFMAIGVVLALALGGGGALFLFKRWRAINPDVPKPNKGEVVKVGVVHAQQDRVVKLLDEAIAGLTLDGAGKDALWAMDQLKALRAELAPLVRVPLDAEVPPEMKPVLAAMIRKLDHISAALKGIEPGAGSAPGDFKVMHERVRLAIEALAKNMQTPWPRKEIGADLRNAGSVVFMVNASSSLVQSLPKLQHYLTQCVKELDAKQTFKVVFYQNTETFEAPNAKGLIAADAAGRAELEAWIKNKALISKGVGNPRKGLERALAYKPDLIYILADSLTGKREGELSHTDLVLLFDQALGPAPKTRVGTVQFYTEDVLESMKAVAEKYNGLYTLVPPPPDVKSLLDRAKLP